MNTKDFDKFALVWRATSEYYNTIVTDGSLGLSFKNLEKYALTDIEHAINAHIRDTENGRFAPKVADIIKHIELKNHDGRLSSDEAWSIAMQSFDEHATVILNDEIAQALSSARYIFESGDKVGARMAFKKHYERLVDSARENGNPAKWWPSVGFDKTGREAAIEEGVRKGYLTSESLQIIESPSTKFLGTDGTKKPEVDLRRFAADGHMIVDEQGDRCG